jgi:3-isopropylmalate/(R)-2-methylmalate dehydratase large subunit
MSKTLFDKLWDQHTVAELGDGECLLYIDRIFLHERTGSIALQSIAEKGRSVRAPERVFVTMDHIVDTFPGRGDETLMPSGRDFIEATRKEAKAAGLQLFDIGDVRQGIVHVVSPEQGIALPGLTLVCPDSHTCTLGGIGTLAWGIGSTDAEHALVTSTLRVRKPCSMRVQFTGKLNPGVTAKDMILHLIGRYSASGGQGCAVEFSGPVITALPIEARLTLCNMAVEFSAFTGLIAPDEKTIEYTRGRPFAPAGDAWEQAAADWRELKSDDDAKFDFEITVDCAEIQPTVTWGTSPQHIVAIDGVVPDPEAESDPSTRRAMVRALEYMDLRPGTAIEKVPVDAAFLGSCTNARLSDLRLAADYLRGRKVAESVKAVVVPGSSSVKQAAEAEGLDQVFRDAGFEWRESGCSMCFYAGGETFGFRQRVISSTNRNFEGRQGPGTRTHLASPLTVVASACAGFITAASMTPEQS